MQAFAGGNLRGSRKYQERALKERRTPSQAFCGPFGLRGSLWAFTILLPIQYRHREYIEGGKRTCLAQFRQLEKEANQEPPHAEALRRSALGRDYYAAFCYARNYAVQYLGYHRKEFGDDHGSLRAHLKKSRRGGDAARLDMLRQIRNNADYADDLTWADAVVTVKEANDAAERVFASLALPRN